MQRRKDLTATEGHVVLLEYFEEYPLMLSHPGRPPLHPMLHSDSHLTAFLVVTTMPEPVLPLVLRQACPWLLPPTSLSASKILRNVPIDTALSVLWSAPTGTAEGFLIAQQASKRLCCPQVAVGFVLSSFPLRCSLKHHNIGSPTDCLQVLTWCRGYHSHAG